MEKTLQVCEDGSCGQCLACQHQELLEALADMVAQACSHQDGILCSRAISTYAYVIDLLAKYGLVEVVARVGDYLHAKWRDTAHEDRENNA